MQLALNARAWPECSSLLGFPDNWNARNLRAYSFAHARSPNISREKNFYCGGQWNRQNWPKQAANQQSPNKNGDDDGHWMQSNRFLDNTRGVKHPFEILDGDEYNCDNQRMRPVAPLKCRNQNGWDPANHNSDVRNHRQDNDEQANQGREIKTEECERAPNKRSIDQTNEQLPAE